MAFLAASYKVTVVDVDERHLMLDPVEVERAITPHTRAIVTVHLFGQRHDPSPLQTLCAEREIALIEDCAHRLDLLDTGAPAGDFACYSFNAVKEAPAGEGGVVWCKSEDDAKAIRALSNVGMNVDTVQRSERLSHHDYDFGRRIGLKLRNNDVTASLVAASLDVLPETRCRRRELFARYDQGLRDIGAGHAVLSRGADDSFLMYVLRVPAAARDRIRSRLAADGVATSVHYPSLSRHPLLDSTRCPVAEGAAAELITLPAFPAMTEDDQSTVLEALGHALSPAGR